MIGWREKNGISKSFGET